MGLIKSMIKEGMEVYAIAPRDTYTHYLTENNIKFEQIRMDSTGTNPIKDFALTIELYRIYKKVKPDIILHFTIKPNIYGTFASRMLKIPTINNVSGLGTIFLNKNFTTSIALFMYKLAFNHPFKVFFQNEFDKQVFLDLRLINNHVTEIIPGSGININYFKPVLTLPKLRFTFLLISRLIIDKGIIEYVEAAKILRNQGVEADFQILGPKEPGHRRGISEKTIEEWIDEGIITYLGVTKDVRNFINMADCIVLPSYREGTPRTLLEAASLGKPIVTTNVPGCNNVVEDGFNGFLCNMKDADDLALNMNKMLNLDKAERRTMGANSRKKIEDKFDERIVIQKYLDAIYSIKIKRKVQFSIKKYFKEKLVAKQA
jgi:glycosyltransferase involved in cell wall biosynthesis